MHFPPLMPRLRDLFAAEWVRRLARLAAWMAVAGYFALGLLVLALRHFVLPGIDNYRGDIERALSQALTQPVAIRAIDAGWHGLWPSLRIHGLEIRDAEGRPALGLDNVEADLAWSSLWHLAPHFARLVIESPSVDLRRDAEGRLFVAGLELKTDNEPGDDFSDWLLAQDRVVIRNATVTWHDELRQAPPLALSRLNFDLRNSGSHHRFGLTAEPPKQLAARLDIRGDFRGLDLDALDAWKGEAYAELDYADLAGWRAWLDYPVELPRGSGGLRLWLGFANKQVTGVTADVRLADTALRLAPDLPMLTMERLDGRLGVRRLDDGFAFQARHLALATHDGIRIEPADLEFKWHLATGTRPTRGEATANGLDLGALAELAVYLPLTGDQRTRLADYGPQGTVHDLSLSWTGDAEKLTAYSLKARFEDLGLRAQGVVPGFDGLDGRIDGDQKGGKLELASHDVVVELPAVFAEPKMALAVLDATADWKISGGVVDAHLRKASFRNADAAGEAAGSYRGSGTGPGEIDLTAKLSRATGGAVWRYMPLVVNQDTRDWLRNSIIGGAATASLRLKGDLQRFPFRDGSGIFEVKGPFQGATLRYAPDWPAFEDVAGDLEFVGARMVIRAQRAKLWGVQLADVKAEIPDLEKAEMVVTGIARGPTADFLRFIEASPVGASIDHFTQDMVATGGGELRLRLDMPLLHIADTRVDGRFRLTANGLTYDGDMPPLADVNGELHFTGDQLDARKVRATMLGAPMTLDVATEDGRVFVKAAGSVTVRGLRQQYDQPLFEHLSGSAPWSGTIRVRKRAAEVRIESTLQGMSSSLPEPFNKTAADVLPLVFERKPPPEPAAPPKGKRPVADKSPAERDQLKVSLGDSLSLQLVRRHDNGKPPVVEQGLIAVGRPDVLLPDRGVLLAVKAKRLDVDFWRRLATGSNGSNGGGGGAPAVSDIDLRADEVLAFGRSVNALQLTGGLDGNIWKVDLKSREATGKVEWSGQGAGRLSGRLSRLDLPESTAPSRGEAAGESAERMPAIDLAVERFSLHGREVGELWVEAENTDGIWNARFDAKNEDGTFEGKGRWKTATPATPANTVIDFKLTTKSVEGMLRRLGYPETVRRGTATLEGGLSWAGPPTALDYASLGGKLRLEAANGQFNKLEPGVGRLLGIVSLQSLPRRISLDFRDIFSEGFVFDSIGGQMTVNRGVMETTDFQIQGPAARVLMNGKVDLARESQDLKVRVQPALGETVATGVLLVNPVVGAAAWVMNKVFGNPLDKAFAFDYAVTGSWADPKVEKVAAQGPGATPAAGSTP
ncbi:MAG TPA: YhdP family protein [Rhodocyclaceae bacterium]|nr:YhdP family protein [Rhodocyclaceae bacterium]